jgi:phi13 family phage major tail protein
MTLELTNVDPATLALMLGQRRANGITVETPLDQAPYFALGFRVWIGGTDADGNKIFQYVWYTKGKFSVPESGGNTKAESIEFQHISLTAQFVPTLYKADGNSGTVCTHCRSDIDTSSAVIAAWFNAPVFDVSVDTSKLTVAIAEGSTPGTITVTGTKASGADCVFAAASVILGSTLIVTDSNGALVPGSVAVEDDEITFTPTVAFASSDVVTVTVTSGIKDVNGVSATPTTESVTIA